MRADITPMINTSIKNNHIAIENLFKSIFSEVPNTTIDLKDSSIHISHNDKNNTDAASILPIGMVIHWLKMKKKKI